jgi:membrane protein DedA with SNARE-associated domain
LVTLDELLQLYDYFGYLGILSISFIISILIFIPIPYFPIPFIAAFNKNLDPHLISLAGTIGAVSAKMIIFYLSYYGRNILGNKTKKRMFPLQKLLSKYGWLGAFIASMTPLSGNVIYISLGLTKYNPWKFVTAIFAGELFYNEIIVSTAVFLGRPFVERIILETTTNQINFIIEAVISIGIVGITLYLLVKMDWAKLIGKWFPWAIIEEEEDDDHGKKETDNK